MYTILVLLLCASANAQPQTIDLTEFGYPPAAKPWNPDSCTDPYRGYHWVEWLDDQNLVLVFNTSPVCPLGVQDASISGDARVVVLTTAGKLEAKTDIPYVADLWQRETPGRGLAIGPGGTILVIVDGVPWEAVPNADGMVRVFTRDLQPVQEILTETASTTMEYKTFTHFGLHFEGVATDRNAVVFSQDTGIGKPQKCFLFAGAPLKQAAECGPDLLRSMRENFDAAAPFPSPENEIPTVFLGRSTGGWRRRSIGQLAGWLTPPPL